MNSKSWRVNLMAIINISSLPSMQDHCILMYYSILKDLTAKLGNDILGFPLRFSKPKYEHTHLSNGGIKVRSGAGIFFMKSRTDEYFVRVSVFSLALIMLINMQLCLNIVLNRRSSLLY